MVGNTTIDSTGVKDIPLQSTDNEKISFNVCFTTKVVGTKMKPFIVFESVKQEATTLSKEF